MTGSTIPEHDERQPITGQRTTLHAAGEPERLALNSCTIAKPTRSHDGANTMKTTKDHDERIARMTFASVYPHYVTKVEKKGRTVEELHQVISWLTGYKSKDLQRLIKNNATFAQFFSEATLNPNASLITGSICGYRIEEIGTPLTRQARYLDKLVDELAKGRKMEKILRTP